MSILYKVMDKISEYKYQVIFLYLYKLTVDLVYYFEISDNRSVGFGVEISIWNIIISYVFLGVYSRYLQWNLTTKKISSLLLRIIVIMYFIPITTWCGIGLGTTEFLITSLFYWALLSVLDYYIPVICIEMGKRNFFSKKLFYGMIAIVSVLTLYISIKYTGFRFMMSITEDIYEVRAEAAGYNIPIWLSYFHSFSTIIITMLILIAVKMRKYVMVLWCGFLMLLTYSYDASKSIFFLLILTICGVIFWNEKLKALILPGCASLGLLCAVEKAFQRTYIVHFFFTRMGIELARLSELYMRYFTENPRDVFRSTILGKVGFRSPYTKDIAYVIGNNFDTQVVNDNNGLLADVWMNLGGIGIIVMPIVIIVTLRLFDAVSVGVKEKYLVGIAVYYAQIFTNATWSTGILTHGFLIMCGLMLLFPREETHTEGDRRDD